MMAKWNTPTLGNCASVLVGFLWGGLFTFALMHNAILPVVLMLNCWNDNSQDFQLFFPKIFNFISAR